jgi:hypothetical protein
VNPSPALWSSPKVVVIEPTRELAGLVPLVNGSQVLVGGFSTLLLDEDELCSD